MKRKPSFCFALVLAFCAVCAAQSSNRESLRGLPGVQVVIGDIDDAAATQRGLSASQLQADVELQLRKAGISVLTEKEWADNPSHPTLDVAVTLMAGSGPAQGIYSFAIVVRARQIVSTLSTPSIHTEATTWNAGASGMTGKNQLGTLRAAVTDFVNQFINDYLAVNPSKGSR